jgi:hypothetical protein
MSKKLIAVAAAAALALTGLVGVAPANATAPAAAFTTIGSGDGSTSALAATVSVTRANLVGATATGIALNLTSLATGDVVRVQTTGGVRLLGGAVTGSADVNVTAAGSTDVSYTHSTADGTTSTTKVWTAYTKSTATGTIVINVSRTGLTFSKTLYLKGTFGVGDAVEYNIANVTGIPATLAANGTAAITFTVTDAFGNAVENDTSILNVATIKIGGTNIATAPTWDSTAKVYKATITAPTSSTFIVEVMADTTDPSVAGLVAANWRHVAVVNNPAVAAQITALTAQITALTADYNALATKYNKLVKKSKRVAKK